MVDVTIRGAGIFGLSIAWECRRRGASVRLIDPNGVGSGSSGGLVGALAPHVPENWNAKKAFQLESLLMTEEFWCTVKRYSDHDPGYCRSGRVQPIDDQATLDLAHQRAQGAALLWRDAAVWCVEESQEDGWTPPSRTGWIIRDTLSALLHPRNACDALAEALEQHDVHIEADGPCDGQTLWATGVAGLHDLNALHHRQMGNGVKGQAALLDANARGLAQVFVDGMHIVPHLDGTVAVGSTSEREYSCPDATDEKLSALIDKARAAIPKLRDAAILERWAGVRPRARSRAPMLGHWPGRNGHFIANGGFKIGFGMAPKVAQVMADLMLEGRNGIPPEFDVTASY